MRGWDAERLARAAGAKLLAAPSEARADGPAGVAIDSRRSGPGDLFIGLPGAREDGGAHAPGALANGAWGVLVSPRHTRAAAASSGGGAVLEHPAPLQALQDLATAWRGELQARGARVVAVTGSTGKTSTKDILAALLAPLARTFASPANHNTEIGLPLAILAAAEDVEVLVLEMAMRGAGQIAQLTEIARPDVGVIVNVGPAHLELLGSVEAVAAAKAELIAGLDPGRTVVVPFGERLLAAHLRADLRTVTFGDAGADVSLAERLPDGGVVIFEGAERMRLWPSFSQAHNLRNLLAAVAAARALSYTPGGPLEVSFSARRGQRVELAGGGVLIDDCYNANPMSMRAALEDLAATARGRRVAVLGEMLELGAEAPQLHREIGRFACAQGVELLIAVGPLASEMASAFTPDQGAHPIKGGTRHGGAQAGRQAGEAYAVADADAAAELLERRLAAGDTVLVKASRGVGLERVCAALTGMGGPGREQGGPAAPGGMGAAAARTRAASERR